MQEQQHKKTDPETAGINKAVPAILL